MPSPSPSAVKKDKESSSSVSTKKDEPSSSSVSNKKSEKDKESSSVKVTETETEFLNQLRKNLLIVVDPLFDDILVKWSMAFRKLRRCLAKNYEIL